MLVDCVEYADEITAAMVDEHDDPSFDKSTTHKSMYELCPCGHETDWPLEKPGDDFTGPDLHCPKCGAKI